MTLSRRAYLGQMTAWLAAFGGAVMRAPAALAQEVAAGLDKIRGLVIKRDHPDYELWRESMVWYLHKPPRYPDTIIRAESEEDVIAAINHARTIGAKVITRATGHNPARGSLREGGILLDTSRLRGAEIDAEAGTAWVQPGMRSVDFIEQTRPLGWAFPAAHTDIVGLGGYLLGGGLGWNMPTWDIACRSIIGAEIVLADGSKVMATADENPDLLWAVRGAGPGFFGAVLRYQLKLFKAPAAIIKSKYLISIDQLPEVLEQLDALSNSEERRRELEILAVIGRFGYPDVKPADRDLVVAVSFIAFGESTEDANQMLQIVRQSRIPTMAQLKSEDVEMTFHELYGQNETDFSSPRRTAIHNIWTNDIKTAMATLAERWQQTPPASPQSFLLTAWGVNPSKDDADSSFTYAGDHYLSWYLMADDDSHVEPNFQWMDESVELLQPLTAGHYLNEINPGRYPDALKACFSDDKWERLAQLRAQYDPDGLFFSWLGSA